MPRHPPCALHSLPPPTPHHTHPQSQADRSAPKAGNKTSPRSSAAAHYKDARVHYPDLKQQPHTSQPRASRSSTGPAGQAETTSHTADASEPQQCAPTTNPSINLDQSGEIINGSTSEHHQTPRHDRPGSGCVLLRKEVIQPHLPVRLPCYDFVPIADPTFDSSF